MYPLFFSAAVSIINNQPEKWKCFITIRLWGMYILWHALFFLSFRILLFAGMLIYALFYEFGIAIFLNWLQQGEFRPTAVIAIFNTILLLIQSPFFLVPYLLVETQLPIFQTIKESFSKTCSHILFIVRMVLIGGLILCILAALPEILGMYSQSVSSTPLYKITFFLFFNSLRTTFIAKYL